MEDTMLRWEKAPYGSSAWFADVPGVGRYLIRRRESRRHEFVLLLNNVRTKYYGSADELKRTVERICNAARMSS
jgi:hypothetical protein